MATQPKAETILMADHKTAVDDAKAAGVTEGHASGVASERTRVNEIMESDEGKARPNASLAAAMKTSMTAEEAIGFLAGLPEEKAEAVAPAPVAEPKGAGAPEGMLAAAMEGTPNP